VTHKATITIPFLLILCGCAVGPDYHRPVTAAPATWAEPDGQGVDSGKPAAAAWWTTLGDPVLDSLIARAVDANHDLRIAEARVREALARRGVTAADLGPAVNADGSASRKRRSSTTSGSFGPLENSNFQLGFDMSWELDFWGRIRRSVEAADAEIGSARFDRDAVLVTLLGEVGRNYVELRGFQQRRAVSLKNIEVQASALDLTRKRFEAGLTSELDVQQAATQLASTRSTLPTLEAGEQRSVHRLSVLLGRDPGALKEELKPVAEIPADPAQVPIGLPSELLERRPDINKAERDLAAATARIGVATAELFPRINLAGSLGLQSGRADDLFNAGSRFWSIGPGLSWPVLDWGRIRANIRVQDARTEQALMAYERVILTSFEEVENALVDYNKERQRRAALEDAVTASRRAVELAQKQYTSGLRDFLNVLTTQRAQFEAEDQLVASRQRVAASLIALYKALGGGWDVDFTAPIEHQDPQRAHDQP